MCMRESLPLLSSERDCGPNGLHAACSSSVQQTSCTGQNTFAKNSAFSIPIQNSLQVWNTINLYGWHRVKLEPCWRVKLIGMQSKLHPGGIFSWATPTQGLCKDTEALDILEKSLRTKNELHITSTKVKRIKYYIFLSPRTVPPQKHSDFPTHPSPRDKNQAESATNPVDGLCCNIIIVQHHLLTVDVGYAASAAEFQTTAS